MDETSQKESILKTWIWLIFMVIIIFAFGLLAFFTVSDKGEPSFDYRPVKALPAESPYAVYPKLPFPQHINSR